MGSIYWLSPEAVKKQPQTTAVDVWAMGVVLYEMVCKNPPYWGRQKVEILNYIMNKGVSLPSEVQVSNLLKEFIARCLEFFPQQRATTEQLLQHPWITSTATQHSVVGSHYVPNATVRQTGDMQVTVNEVNILNNRSNFLQSISSRNKPAAETDSRSASSNSFTPSPLAVALYDYTQAQEGVLTFRAGQTMKIIKKENQVWWVVELEGKTGYAAVSYIQEKKEEAAPPSLPPLPDFLEKQIPSLNASVPPLPPARTSMRSNSNAPLPSFRGNLSTSNLGRSNSNAPLPLRNNQALNTSNSNLSPTVNNPSAFPIVNNASAFPTPPLYHAPKIESSVPPSPPPASFNSALPIPSSPLPSTYSSPPSTPNNTNTSFSSLPIHSDPPSSPFVPPNVPSEAPSSPQPQIKTTQNEGSNLSDFSSQIRSFFSSELEKAKHDIIGFLNSK